MFTISVYNENNGAPAKNIKVGIVFDGITRGYTKDEYTDSRGECHFDYENGTGIIYANGSKVYEGSIEGKTIVYI